MTPDGKACPLDITAEGDVDGEMIVDHDLKLHERIRTLEAELTSAKAIYLHRAEKAEALLADTLERMNHAEAANVHLRARVAGLEAHLEKHRIDWLDHQDGGRESGSSTLSDQHSVTGQGSSAASAAANPAALGPIALAMREALQRKRKRKEARWTEHDAVCPSKELMARVKELDWAKRMKR